MLSFQQKSASTLDVSVVEHLLATHMFYHITLHNNNWGGIGIYISNEITNVIVNSSFPGHIGHYFAYKIFKCIFMNEKNCISIRFLEVCSQGPRWQYFNIGSDNGLVPNRRQAIILTNADRIHWRIYAALRVFEINNKVFDYAKQLFSFKDMHFKMSSAKWRSFCLGLNVSTKVSGYRNHQAVIDFSYWSVDLYAWCRKCFLNHGISRNRHSSPLNQACEIVTTILH